MSHHIMPQMQSKMSQISSTSLDILHRPRRKLPDQIALLVQLQPWKFEHIKGEEFPYIQRQAPSLHPNKRIVLWCIFVPFQWINSFKTPVSIRANHIWKCPENRARSCRVWHAIWHDWPWRHFGLPNFSGWSLCLGGYRNHPKSKLWSCVLAWSLSSAALWREKVWESLPGYVSEHHRKQALQAENRQKTNNFWSSFMKLPEIHPKSTSQQQSNHAKSPFFQTHFVFHLLDLLINLTVLSILWINKSTFTLYFAVY